MSPPCLQSALAVDGMKKNIYECTCIYSMRAVSILFKWPMVVSVHVNVGSLTVGEPKKNTFQRGDILKILYFSLPDHVAAPHPLFWPRWV